MADGIARSLFFNAEDQQRDGCICHYRFSEPQYGLYRNCTADGLRWTNGDATMPAELFADFRGGGMNIELTLAGATQYPDFGGASQSAAA